MLHAVSYKKSNICGVLNADYATKGCYKAAIFQEASKNFDSSKHGLQFLYDFRN